MNIAEMVLEASTKAIGTMVHPVYAPESSLEEHLATFTLGLTELAVWDVLNEISFGVGNETFVSYELGNYSPNLKGIYEYNAKSGIVSITRGNIKLHVSAFGVDTTDDKSPNLELVNKRKIVEEILACTNEAIAVLFYQHERSKCALEQYLRNFDLNLSITEAMDYLDKHHVEWENAEIKPYYGLGNISPTTRTRFTYNPKDDTYTLTPLMLVDHIKDKSKRTFNKDWLNPNTQLDEKAAIAQLKAIAALFWVAEAPYENLEVYLRDFEFPDEDVKINIRNMELTYEAFQKVMQIMEPAIPKIRNLFMRVLLVRFNSNVSGKFKYNSDKDTTKVSIKLKQQAVNVSEAFLAINMMPKSKVESELPRDSKLIEIATLFWLVSRPAIPLQVYQTWFIPPVNDGKFVIDSTKLSYLDTISIYRLMDKADKVTRDLFMVVESIRHNPYLKGDFSYTCKGDSVECDVNWTLIDSPKL